MPKKFFWIKLKDNFFKQLAIKKLRKIAGGDTFVIIYLKMMLLSMNTEGKICYECYDDMEFAENLALELDEQEENVNMTLAFLKTHKLIDFLEDGSALLPEAVDCIGCETEAAERMRKMRSNKTKNELPCNKDVTMLRDCYEGVTEKLPNCSENVTLEKEKEKEKDIDIEIDKKRKSIKRKAAPTKNDYATSVKLSTEEYDNLVSQYGEQAVREMISILNNYKESTGKKYKSDAAAIRSWVITAYFERANKGSPGNLVDIQQELARRVGENGNDVDADSNGAIWGVWGK